MDNNEPTQNCPQLMPIETAKIVLEKNQTYMLGNENIWMVQQSLPKPCNDQPCSLKRRESHLYCHYRFSLHVAKARNTRAQHQTGATTESRRLGMFHS